MIITNADALRLECIDVDLSEYAELKDKLEYELKSSNVHGIGLAAPQIGIAKNMAIIRIDDISIDLVNAKIKNGYDKFLFKNEGCLSFPDIYVDTMRFNEIEICDNLVEPYNFICTGLVAVACQHELDHLVGKILPDLDVRNGR